MHIRVPFISGIAASLCLITSAVAQTGSLAQPRRASQSRVQRRAGRSNGQAGDYFTSGKRQHHAEYRNRPEYGSHYFNLSLTATSGTFTTTVSVAVAVAANSFTVTPAQTALSIKTGATGQATAAITHLGVFNFAVALSWTGLPSGVTAVLSKSALSAPGDGTGVTTFNVASAAKLGAYSATLTATGGGVTQTTRSI